MVLLVIIFIICIFFVLVLPFIIAFTAVITRPFGLPVTYIACGILGNLYAPLLFIFVLMSLFGRYRGMRFNLKLNGLSKSPIEKKQLKSLLILSCILVAFFVYSLTSLINIANLIMDINNLATSNFAEADGIVTTYEVRFDDTYETRLKINGIKYNGGFAYSEEVVEGEKYHVEYLPHSRYIVKYYRIQ